jgi:beta-phosphoglucomutase-like phosphatase (HAD superfamily)
VSENPDIEAIVFDQDGVLIESEPVWDQARRAVVAEAGGRWHKDATREMMGMSAPEWSAYLHDELSVPLPPEEINDRVISHLLASYEKGLPLLPGAIDTVWMLGLASSANRAVIDAVLGASGLTPCFTVTVSGEEVARGKPAPDVYLAATQRLGVDPRRSAAVEDSSNGLRAAAAAGMAVIAVPNRTFPPTGDALALADLTLASLEDLTPAAIASMAARRRAPA